MTKYKVNYGESLTFEGDSPSDVVDFLRETNPFLRDTTDESELLRKLALRATNYNKKMYRFNNREVFAKDLMNYGLLEEVRGYA
jgi:hypothetical protein